MAHADDRAGTARPSPAAYRRPAPGGPAPAAPGRAAPALPISAAAERLGTSPRMLRYREALGLVPPTKEQPTGRGHRHRRFSEDDLGAVAAGLELERAYGIPPAALAFALRVLAEPATLARVRSFGERVGRLAPAPARAMDFEKQKALRLLRRRERGTP
ncbi:MerR family transcriptional regulator [Streptomonospora nanhaiensis]|uniref:DNA-binding transcriptional MerR regulator n=1 Tax=Streptomonospora nanhaiensis TaxID=1323731 RepID=A0A853BMY1_9ACTN|nr:MerR family transcriptional regulator [Streptomonospora nanhaiensis]MBV2362088.1 MerR family transcriptional regulator [Streptomonospora nanhaiensis]MBX9390437.1 MerR family transcriptional regulator [Streptomonospora nanhaiensis]NYI96084.1 DNA-binding transcriptional MerR regulator [Streptomonospora nanhaiensis]